MNYCTNKDINAVMSKLKKFVLLFLNLAVLFSPFVNACKKPPSKINTYSRKSCKKLTAAEIAAEIAASRKLEIDTYSRKSCKKLAEAETAAAEARQKLENAKKNRTLQVYRERSRVKCEPL